MAAEDVDPATAGSTAGEHELAMLQGQHSTTNEPCRRRGSENSKTPEDDQQFRRSAERQRQRRAQRDHDIKPGQHEEHLARLGYQRIDPAALKSADYTKERRQHQ